MPVFIEECKKTFNNKNIIIMSIMIITINIALNFLNEQRRYAENGYVMFKTSSYRELMRVLNHENDSLSYVKEQNEILKEYISYSVLNGSIKEGINGEMLDKMYEDGRIVRFTGNPISESMLFSFVYKEIDDIANYDRYIDDIITRAGYMTSVSLFSDENTFSYRNIIKTANDYSKLKNIKPLWEEGNGIRMIVQFTDVVLLFGVFLVCFMLVTDEKPMFMLLKTTYKGRCTLIKAKIAVSMFYIFILHTLMALILFVSVGLYYGYGDVLRPIQSVFISAPYSMTVLECIILTYILKMFIHAVFTIIFMFLCVRAKSAASTYAFTAVILGVSALLNNIIAPYSYINYFKYVNLYYFLTPSQLLVSYTNINVFGYPVSLIPIAIFFCLIILFAGYIATIHSFAYKYISLNKSITQKAFILIRKFKIEKIKRRHKIKYKNKNSLSNNQEIKPSFFKTFRLFHIECHRLLITNRVIMMLVVLFILQCFRMSLFKTSIDPYEAAYRRLLENAQQQNDPYEWTIKERERLMNSSGKADQIAADRLIERFRYLEDNKDGRLIYDTGYYILLDNKVNALINALIMSAMLIICIPIFYERQLIMLFKTMRLGRRYHTIVKMILMVIITAIVFLVSYIPDVLQIIDAYGFPGLNSPACSIPMLMKIYEISIGEYIMYMYISRFFLALLISLIIYTLSRKNAAHAMIIASVIFIVPLILSFLSVKIVNYYPFNILAETNQIIKNNVAFVIGLPVVMTCIIIVFMMFTIERSDNCLY